MLPALVRSPIAARISGTFRILSWIGILKTSKWGTGKITSAETQEIMPGEVISVALLPFMIIAEVLEGWEAFAKPAFMQHLIFRIADVQKSFETDPRLNDIGMLEKSTYLITNSLLSHRAFAFFHSLLMISLLCGLTLSLVRRGFVSRTPLSAKLLVVLGAFLAAFGVARHTLPLSSILKHGPYVAIVLREIAVNGFDPCHSHQAWSMMFQALASLLTAAVLCADFGGLQGVEAAMNDGKNGAQLAALIVLAISSLVSILRATRKRRDASTLIPVALAVGIACLSGSDKEYQLRLSKFSVVMHFVIASSAMIIGSAACVIPFVILVQCLVKLHNPEGKLIFSR